MQHSSIPTQIFSSLSLLFVKSQMLYLPSPNLSVLIGNQVQLSATFFIQKPCKNNVIIVGEAYVYMNLLTFLSSSLTRELGGIAETLHFFPSRLTFHLPTYYSQQVYRNLSKCFVFIALDPEKFSPSESLRYCQINWLYHDNCLFFFSCSLLNANFQPNVR